MKRLDTREYEKLFGYGPSARDIDNSLYNLHVSFAHQRHLQDLRAIADGGFWARVRIITNSQNYQK